MGSTSNVPTPLEKRFKSAVAAYARNPNAKNKLRMEMAERRMYGVASRNAAKLARNRRPPDKP